MTQTAGIPSSTVANADGRTLFERLRFTPLRDVLRGRITGRLDIAHEIDQGRLPDPLPAMVKNIVRRSRLWRTEKADVARELIAHFRDGLASGASAAELAGMFGDPAQAAKLIRRAKKRNRPLPWRALRAAVRASALFLGVLFVIYLIMLGRFLIGQPTPSIDYRPQINAVASAVPEPDRAWPVYREALLHLQPWDDVIDGSPDYNRRPRPGEEGWKAIADYLRDHHQGLELVRSAASKPGLGYIMDYGISSADKKLWPDATLSVDSSDKGGVTGLLMPHMGSMRNLARILQLDIERAAGDGDGDIVVADVAALLGLARQAREPGFIISELVALAIVNLTFNTVNDVLTKWPQSLTDDRLRELAHRLAACDDSMLRVGLDAERIMFDDVFQRIYTDDGDGDGRVTFKGMKMLAMFVSVTDSPAIGFRKEPVEFIAAPAVCEMMLGRKAIREEFNRLFALAAADSAVPMWLHDHEPFDQAIEAIADSPIEKIRKFPVLAMMPALGRLWQNTERSILARDAVLTALALTLFHRQQNSWPTSLNELTPSLLPTVPIDRFDGKPLKYALVDCHPVLYSVGTDRDDDGGREPVTANGKTIQGAASKWISPSRLAERKQDPRNRDPWDIPDGDWVLWPGHIDPLYRVNQSPQ